MLLSLHNMVKMEAGPKSSKGAKRKKSLFFSGYYSMMHKQQQGTLETETNPAFHQLHAAGRRGTSSWSQEGITVA